MRRDHAIVQETDPVEISDGAGAFFFNAVVKLALCLCDVSDDRCSSAISKRANGFEVLFGNRVGSMWSDRGNDEVMPFPTRDKLLHIRHSLSVVFVVRDGKVNDRFTEH